jgi:hypothetical protein
LGFRRMATLRANIVNLHQSMVNLRRENYR